jgi:hypothetical protein
MFSDRVEVVTAAEADSLAQYLGNVLGEEVTFSVGIGNARVNRKPVLQVFGASGGDLAFVKIGNSPVSRADVGAEARALATLSSRTFVTLEVPRVLHSGTWNGMVVLVMSSLPTTIQRSPKSRRPVPIRAMRELGEAFQQSSQTLEGSLLWQRSRGVADRLEDQRHRERLVRAMDLLADRAQGRSWDIGAWHGDWTPWNMARRGNVVQLWDWERFETGVIVGLDRYHYAVNEFCRTHGMSVSAIHAALQTLVRDDGAGPDARVLAGIYLVAITVRYLSLAQGLGGEAIRQQGETTLSALDSWLCLRD